MFIITFLSIPMDQTLPATIKEIKNISFCILVELIILSHLICTLLYVVPQQTKFSLPTMMITCMWYNIRSFSWYLFLKDPLNQVLIAVCNDHHGTILFSWPFFYLDGILASWMMIKYMLHFLTHSCLEIFLTFVVWTYGTFENNLEIKHKLKKKMKGICKFVSDLHLSLK